MAEQSSRPGDWRHTTRRLDEIALDRFRFAIPTERYRCPEFAAREWRRIWLRTWQVAGRADEIPHPGDWLEYRLGHHSYLVVRGGDGRLRAFVNSCRHRGNKLASGRGHGGRITCPYHLWTYALDGRLVGCARPDLVGPIDKDSLGLIEVPADSFAGFVFVNPDPKAPPLADYLGSEVRAGLAPYHLEEMVPVGMDVEESLPCNWKVVIDAFSEGYHIIGVHPQLLEVIDLAPGASRFGLYGDHDMAVAPFEVADTARLSHEQQVEAIRRLPETFPSVAEVLPRFEALVASHRDPSGRLTLPAGVTVRTLLQKATRETLEATGLDTSGLSDDQMTDNQGWFLFPNFFMTIRAGEAITIVVRPDPGGDPTRCVWRVTSLRWLPPEQRAALRAEPIAVREPGSYPYFLALQQDYEQMPRQQQGLMNEGLTHLLLVPEELSVARFHSVLDQWLDAPSTADSPSPSGTLG